MSVRMRDIANQLGLSVSTVSLALRAAPQVAEETRVRVMDVAEQLGYTVRQRPQRQELIRVAFITRDDPGNDFYAEVLSGAENECRQHGMSLHFLQINDQNTNDLISYLAADGVLMVGSIGETVVQRVRQFDLPMVLVDNNLPFQGLDRVVVENMYSMYRATNYALGHGHRALAFLCGPVAIPSFKERLIGYRTAMQEAGLPTTELYFSDRDARDVATVLEKHIRSLQSLEFTALLGCNDKSILRAFHALHDHGLHVPHDISLIGFDDLNVASVIRPALTTSRVPRDMLGRLAVQRLAERYRNPALPTLGISLDTTLIERDSFLARGG